MTLKELLKDKEHWHQGTYAATIHGSGVRVQSDAAYKFCLVGACIKLYDVNVLDDNDPYLLAICSAIEEICKAENTEYLYLESRDNDIIPSLDTTRGKIIAFNDHPLVTFEHIKKVIENLEF